MCTLALACVGGCAQTQKGLAFESPEAAVSAMVAGLRADDDAAMRRIMGSDADELLHSGDDVADAEALEAFFARFDEQHRLTPGAEPDVKLLEVGNDAWPMPIPLVRDPDGWRFDTAAGLDELLSRRIGRNELDTIQTMRAMWDAQREYFALNPRGAATPEFAMRAVSSEGTRDGLYWPVAEGETMSPLGELVAEAIEDGYGGGRRGGPFHGYMFRIITAQGPRATGGTRSYLDNGRLTGGFAVIAYPAEYGNSGVMTFIMNHQGIVYQQDLGTGTASRARGISAFDPGPEWTLVEGR